MLQWDAWHASRAAAASAAFWLVGLPINSDAAFPALPSMPHVVSAAGVIKDAEWIKGLHIAVMKALLGGNMRLCRGVHMDNTKANCKAMMLMEEQCPWLVHLGCAAHGLSLSIKDLGSIGKLQQACWWARCWKPAR